MLDGRTCAHARATLRPRCPSLIAALDESGHAVAKLSLSRPSLDDVYLRVAGRAFHEADSEQPRGAAG